MEQKISRIRLLTDRSGQEFYEQAVRYVQHRYGLDFLDRYAGLPSVWEEQEEHAREYQGEEYDAREELEQELVPYVKAGDTILVKASHFMGFPAVVAALQK